MAFLLPHHIQKQGEFMRDVRPIPARIAEFMVNPQALGYIAFIAGGLMVVTGDFTIVADVGAVIMLLYLRWFLKQPFIMPFKFPRYANCSDPHNPVPGKPGGGKADGILYLGNVSLADHPDNGRELWLTNTDARTHILYLGTTGSGKTEGLKAIVTNALAWGSGFVYVDGKADTDLWASLYALVRRFGREDDLLILNYMTANSDAGSVSNTMNPFSNGSASYLANMIVSLMPDAGGDNAMWKERAVALMFALMPALTYKRDHEGLLLDVGSMRDYIEMGAIIRLSRDPNLPERVVRGLQGYLSTLPGYVDAAFDDEGNERPPSPDQPMYDLQVARQQHGYLSMQFTRSLQSLADEYGYIFKVQLADVDVLDVVLNRRVLVALIPALEKSGEEAANLGKIVAASLKGMMGATLGNTVQGSWESAIGSKQTRSSSSFMTVFDEVGYYTAPGMAVMAAQARSLGFSLIFAAQDLPSMEKRVKQEAQSILGNCNLKIFGKLEDPTDTKKFFDDHVGDEWVVESTGMSAPTDTVSNLFLSAQFYDSRGAGGPVARSRAGYKDLRKQREGQAIMLFAEYIAGTRLFYAVPGKVKALRVHRLLPVPGTTTAAAARERATADMAAKLKTMDWTALAAGSNIPAAPEIAAMASALGGRETGVQSAAAAVLAAARTAPTSRGSGLAMDAPAALSAGGGGATGAPPATAKTGKPLVVPKELSVQIKTESGKGADHPVAADSGGATLQQGDEFAFMALDEYAPKAAAVGAADPTMPGFVPDGEEFRTRSASDQAGADEDIIKTPLPAEVASVLAAAAERLNAGLTGAASDAE